MRRTHDRTDRRSPWEDKRSLPTASATIHALRAGDVVAKKRGGDAVPETDAPTNDAA